MAMAEPGYPPRQLQWPTNYGENFASTCWGCRTRRSADAEPKAQLPLYHLGPHIAPLAPAVQVAGIAHVTPPVVPTYLHGVHTVASALDLKKSVPVPVGAPAPTYPNIVVPTVPAVPKYTVAPVAPAVPAVPLPAVPAYLPAVPVAPAAAVAPEVVTPVKVGAGVHPEGILGHVARSPEGFSDFTRLNIAGTHIPVLSALPEGKKLLLMCFCQMTLKYSGSIWIF